MPTAKRNHPDDQPAIESLHNQYAAKLDRLADELIQFQDQAYTMGHDRGLLGAGSAVVIAHLQRQRDWSEKTFGPGTRAAGIVDHIRKELLEIEADPGDLAEWVDVVILALDGAWRSGATPEQIIEAIKAKQTKNEGRVWPDWRTMSADKAIEHDRTADNEGAQQ